MILNAASTEMGGAESAFPKTRWSVVLDAGDEESPEGRRSLDDLARLYWRPVYAYFRRKWRRSNEEAKDLTQEFFAAMADRNYLGGLRPENGRFRSYVMAALDNFARGEHRRSRAAKRGGGVPHLSFEIGAGFEPSPGRSPEEAFLRDWAESVLDDALREMEEEYAARGKGDEFALFVAKDVEAPPGEDASYEALGARFGFKVTQVTHALYFARKRLRELVLKRVRDSVTSASEAEAEMMRLFSDPPR